MINLLFVVCWNYFDYTQLQRPPKNIANPTQST